MDGIAKYSILPGQVSTAVSTAVQGETTIYNLGPSKVWLNEYKAPGGFPLDVSDSMTWNPGKPLFVSADTASDILVLENGGKYASNRALAQAIISEGLAGDIASAIQISGAPPVNRVGLVASSAQAATVADFTTFPIDVSEYNSVNVLTTLTLAGTTNVPTQFRSLGLYWYDSDPFLPGATACGADLYNVGASSYADRPTCEIAVPLRYPWLRVALEGQRGVNGGAAAACSTRVLAYASTRTVTSSYRHAGLPSADVLINDGRTFAYYTNSKTTGASQVHMSPALSAARAKLTFIADTVTTAGSVYLYDAEFPGGYYYRASFPVSAARTTITEEISLPVRPINIAYYGSGTNITINLTQY